MTTDSGTTLTLPTQSMTISEWTELDPGETGVRIELVDGGLTVVPPPAFNHAVVITRLTVWFAANGISPDLIVTNVGLVTGHVSVRIPDLMVLRERVNGNPAYVTASTVSVVVEVVSPGSRTTDRLVKPKEYASAGVPRHWRVEGAVNPDHAMVHMHGPDGNEVCAPWRLTDLLIGDLITVLGEM